MVDSETLARSCAAAAADKKAGDIVAMDMRSVSDFTDFFVVCSADSEPQLKAIASSIREKVRQAHGQKPKAEDGFPSSQWIVVDYGDVICHLFLAGKRALYDLEGLWSDAPRLEVET
jgi:ribosome-associated protein